MTLRKQIVETEVEQLGNSYSLSDDAAFTRLAHSLVTGQGVSSFNVDDLVDGGGDKQLDTITIDQEGDEATVYFIQTKNSDSFSSNALIQMKNGLEWVFSKSKTDVNALANQAFKDKILEYRQVQSGVGPSNINVIVAFVTKGDTKVLSNEFKEELKSISEKYDNDTFRLFQMRVWGADELVAEMNRMQRKSKKVDAELRIRYDANNPSLIKYYADDVKGVVCTVGATELARIINDDTEGSVFDANIRQYIGIKGAKGDVNKEIRHTATDAQDSHLFWFLNNGITIVCDGFDPVTDPDKPHIKIKNMQIVNGCQTATTLARAQSEGTLSKDVRVLVRIYQAESAELIDKVVLTTNNQNKITNRNLRANDPLQRDMELAMSGRGYYYERKPQQYDKAGVPVDRILPNELVAQSYLAVVLKRPSDARGRKYKVWEELYSDVFTGGIIEPYILSHLIYRHAGLILRANGFTADSDDVKRKIAKVGGFHIARIAAFLWRNGDLWTDSGAVQTQISELETNPSILDAHVEKAFNILLALIKSDTRYVADLETALKAHVLDADIDRELYTRHRVAPASRR